MSIFSHELLKKAWGEAFLRRFKSEYIEQMDDDKALHVLAKQAERKAWTLHQAVAFFEMSLEVINQDHYWKGRVGLMAASKKINDVYAHLRKTKMEEAAQGDFDYQKFRDEQEKPSHKEVATTEMAKILEILGKKGVLK